MEKNSTKVKIAGAEYTITGYETEEYMQKVGIYVDKKMNEIRQKCFNLDTSMIAVLTAVNIADENLKLYDRIEDLEREIEDLLSRQGQIQNKKKNRDKAK